MYLEGSGPALEDVLLSDQYLFDYSPAESIINFELPTITPNTNWITDLDFSCGFSLSDNKDDFSFIDSSTAFDINALDHNIEESDLLQALNSDKSNDSPFSSTDSTDAEDVLGRLSLYGSQLEPFNHEQVCTDWKIKGVESKVEPKVRSWGEPTFCAEFNAYRCPVEECGKLYAKASHVRAHLRRHSGEKPYRCTWGDCAWRFARSDELARHRRSHSGDKPYVCRECGKRFARSDHLTKHGRVHARRRTAALAAAATAKRANGSYYQRTRRAL